MLTRLAIGHNGRFNWQQQCSIEYDDLSGLKSHDGIALGTNVNLADEVVVLKTLGNGMTDQQIL